MTTDRTAAPARNTAVATPAPGGARPANGKPQSAPNDVFSTLLGAVAPKADDTAPRTQPRDRGPDNGLKPKDIAKDAPKPKPAGDSAPADEATETEDAPKLARLVTPEIFALQLASPLPATPAEPTPAAAAQPAAAAETPQPAAPALPPFATQLQAPAAQPQATPPELTIPAPPEPLPATPATPATPAPAATNTGFPLPVLAGLTPASAADQTLAVTAPKPQPTDVTTTPTPDADATQVQNPLANQPQPQTDAGTQGQPQPNPPAPVEAAEPADAPAPAPAAPATPIVAPAPAAPVMPLNAPTGLQRLIPLYKAPESTATMIHIAAERGVTHARLNLKPVELGGIEVRLRTTPEGVSAHLVADSPEAAKLLQSAAADLRRDLEARDVNLLSLDVSTQQEQQRDNPQAAFGDEFGEAQSFGLGANRRRNGSPDDESLTETPASAETTLVLPNGVLVDVLA